MNEEVGTYQYVVKVPPREAIRCDLGPEPPMFAVRMAQALVTAATQERDGVLAPLSEGARLSLDRSEEDHLQVLMEAFAIYCERNKLYRDNWRRSYGWRGLLFDLRRKVDRVWDVFWDAKRGDTADLDDMLDVINYAALATRAVREGCSGFWWES